MRDWFVGLTVLMAAFSAFAQSTANSLDEADPPFTVEERENLVMGNGLYFTKTTYLESSVSGWIYKGTGVLGGATFPGAQYEFFVGPVQVPWEDYFQKVGLAEYAQKYNSVKQERTARTTLGVIGVLIGGGALCFGMLDLGSGRLNRLTHQREYFSGGEGAAIGLAIGGLLVSTAATVYWLTPPEFPPAPSDDYLMLLSNRANRKSLK